MDQSNPALDIEEEIIDLTDIVEKGVVPPALGKHGGEYMLEEQMADLLGENAPLQDIDGDFDLDALLAEGTEEEAALEKAALEKIRGGGTDAVPPAPAPSLSGPNGGTGTDAGETFDLPDMAEVDALLRDLVAPEQPQAAKQETPLAPGPAAGPASGGDDDAGDLEALLGSLAGSPAQPASQPAGQPGAKSGPTPAASPTARPVAPSAAPATAPPLAAKPSGGAANLEGDMEDLDSLLDSIMNPEPEPAENKEAAPTEAPVESLSPPQKSSVALETSGAAARADAKRGAVPDLVEAPAATPQAHEDLFQAAPQRSPGASPKASPEIPSGGAPGGRHGPDGGAVERAGETMFSAPSAPSALPDPGADPEIATIAPGADAMPDFDELDALLDESLSSDAASIAGPPDLAEAEDPLLIGELPSKPATARLTNDRNEDVSVDILRDLESLAADMVVLQEQISAMQGQGGELKAPDDVLARLSDLQDDVRDMAESYADGLAAAEARISALEAELAEQAARRAANPEAHDLAAPVAALAERLSNLEGNFEKVAAASAAKVIREEIAVLLSEMV